MARAGAVAGEREIAARARSRGVEATAADPVEPARIGRSVCPPALPCAVRIVRSVAFAAPIRSGCSRYRNHCATASCYGFLKRLATRVARRVERCRLM